MQPKKCILYMDSGREQFVFLDENQVEALRSIADTDGEIEGWLVVRTLTNPRMENKQIKTVFHKLSKIESFSIPE